MFLVLEGLDGSGKSTQTRRLAGELELDHTAEPTDGPVGSLVREELSRGDLEPETLALLFAADRVQHQPRLEDAVCERYVYSSLAYQAAQGLDPKWLCEINRNARAPDLAILIDVEPDTAMHRLTNGRDDTEIFEKERFLHRVEEQYLAIFEGREPWRSLRDDYGFLDTEFRVVDGDAPVDEVSDSLLSEVEPLL